jgi:hypothetical protein
MTLLVGAHPCVRPQITQPEKVNKCSNICST